MVTLLPIQWGIQLCHPPPNSTIYPQYFPAGFAISKLREDRAVLIRTPPRNLGHIEAERIWKPSSFFCHHRWGFGFKLSVRPSRHNRLNLILCYQSSRSRQGRQHTRHSISISGVGWGAATQERLAPHSWATTQLPQGRSHSTGHTLLIPVTLRALLFPRKWCWKN